MLSFFWSYSLDYKLEWCHSFHFAKFRPALTMPFLIVHEYDMKCMLSRNFITPQCDVISTCVYIYVFCFCIFISLWLHCNKVAAQYTSDIALKYWEILVSIVGTASANPMLFNYCTQPVGDHTRVWAPVPENGAAYAWRVFAPSRGAFVPFYVAINGCQTMCCIVSYHYDSAVRNENYILSSEPPLVTHLNATPELYQCFLPRVSVRSNSSHDLGVTC